MIILLPLIVALAFFLVLGLTATFWTERFRSYWIRRCEQHPGELHWQIIARRVQRTSDSFELRVVGIISLIGAAICVWILVAPKA
jgi:hypothetical protein